MSSVVEGLEPPGGHEADHLVRHLGQDLLAEVVAVVGAVGQQELLHLNELERNTGRCSR